jgi:ubiquinone/menaquinone biosynthesis C-methylase UbiE
MWIPRSRARTGIAACYVFAMSGHPGRDGERRNHRSIRARDPEAQRRILGQGGHAPQSAGHPSGIGLLLRLNAVLDPAIQAHYELGLEQPRLARESTLEWVRTQELLHRYLPAAPASILDVGGGPGVYASWLAEQGHTVHLIDPVERHVAEARAAAAAQVEHAFTAALGDARSLDAPDAAYDAVLLMGPLYHLVTRSDRMQALGEAQRVVRPGGRVIAVGISRFASLLDGLRNGWLVDPAFRAMVEQDLSTGLHRNPEPNCRPEWFTTAYFHRPDELVDEIAAAGLQVDDLLGIEGPGWLIWHERWADPTQRSALLDAARAVEREPGLLGASGHLMAIAHR